MKPFEVFEKLMNKAIMYCLRYPTVRQTPDKYQGTPGELLKHLSEEEREALSHLKSNELSEDVIPAKHAAEISCTITSAEKYNSSFIKKDKLEFDQRIKK